MTVADELLLPAPSPDLDAALLRAALLGASAWGGLALSGRLELAAALLLLGPLVAVPLGLRAAAPEASTPAWRGAAGATLPAALLAGSSFLAGSGWLAVALALPWALLTAAIGLLGLLRLRAATGRLAELSLSAGLILLPVGGAWLLASRAGFPLLGFQEPLPLLTAAHFHFAGFALPILAGLVARAAPGPLSAAGCAGALLGVPLVAIGITLSRHAGTTLVEWGAAWLLAAACVLLAVEQLRLAGRRARGLRQALLLLSGASLLLGMSLAAIYGLGRGLGHDWLDVPRMVQLHASANALGFALPALLAWTSLSLELRPAWRPLALEELADWERREPGPQVAGGPGPGDHLDEHVREAGREAPGPPAADGPHRRAAAAILAYDVFPPRLLRPLVRRVPIEPGDTVGACTAAGVPSRT